MIKTDDWIARLRAQQSELDTITTTLVQDVRDYLRELNLNPEKLDSLSELQGLVWALEDMSDSLDCAIDDHVNELKEEERDE